MNPSSMTITVKLDAKTFKRFSRFDMFRLRRRWVRPVVFALILLGFAAVALVSRRPQSGMIAAVLLAVGLGLPLVYFGSYLSQVNVQALQRGLSGRRTVYVVTLDFDGVRVVNARKKESPLVLKWQDVKAAYRAKGCVYLYVSPVQAFLLPDGQCDAGDEALIACLKEHLGDRYRALTRSGIR